MASVKPTAPAPITSATVQDVGAAGAFLTQEQALALMNAGLASADTTNVQGSAAFVTLTETGLAQLNGTVASPVAKPTFTVRSDIAPPTKRRRGRSGSMYPIETMELNQSFHIPKTDTDPDPASRIASSIANARVKFAVPVLNEDGTPKMVTKTVKTYKKTEDGKAFLKDAEGHRVVDTEKTETVTETQNGRDWLVATVDATDPEGVGARIWRVL